jgi:alginate O-acetyltransferase complex protein AlgI
VLFTELRFVLFFALVFGVYWAMRRDGVRKTWLLLASWAFYAAWDPRFLSLILASTIIDYTAAMRIASSTNRARRKRWMMLSLVANLGLLGVFKYFNFFAEGAVQLGHLLGLELDAVTLDVVLPVGISFYTFQTLSYTLDVYRRQLKVNRNFRDVALFVAFFPQLVAGPIVRASTFLPQMARSRRFADVSWRPMCTLFLIGWFKKACISDQVAEVVDTVFADPTAYGMLDHWLSSALYTIQIYCDFSGYSDMAIATAGMLGYTLPLNFDFPYLAANVSDFWRRWHISLSTWFRDYLYVPLGGNRTAPLRTYVNLVTVFLLCGLWHGANWTFVVWGLYHGAFLVLERAAGWSRKGSTGLPVRLLTLLIVLVGWVIFRSPDLGTAGVVLGRLVGSGHAPTAAVDPTWWLVVPVFAAAHVLMNSGRIADRLSRMSDWAYAAAYGVAVAVALPFAATGYQAFIYFQF